MNKEMYIDILRHLRIAVRRKCPEKQRTNTWIILYDNAPAHRSVLCEDFLTKKNMTKLDLPPYSSDVAAADLTCYLDLNQYRRDDAFLMLLILRMRRES